MNASSQAPNLFGLGAQIFGDVASPSPSPSSAVTTAANPGGDAGTHSDDAAVDLDSDDESSSSSEHSLLTALASTTLDESPWRSAPSYAPLYLSTVSEYLPPQPKSKSKLPPGVVVVDPEAEPSGKDAKDKDISWAFEPYENSLDVDHVFERFTRRVAYEGEQCVR